MKIQKGIVKYKDRDDIVCAYGITDDGRQYYFLDSDYEKTLKNGCRIASTALVEAVDPMVKPNHIGLVSADGVEVIAFNNRSIRIVNDDVILVEPAEAISQNVIAANGLKSDPLSATKLVSTPATIKEKISALMGTDGKYLFNDQFSEATIFDINGNNLVNNEYYSFIAYSNNTLFLSKNYPEFEVVAYTLGTALDSQNISLDISKVNVSSDVVDNALANDVVPNIPDVNAGVSDSYVNTEINALESNDVVPEGDMSSVDNFATVEVDADVLPTAESNLDHVDTTVDAAGVDGVNVNNSTVVEVNADVLPTAESNVDHVDTTVDAVGVDGVNVNNSTVVEVNADVLPTVESNIDYVNTSSETSSIDRVTLNSELNTRNEEQENIDLDENAVVSDMNNSQIDVMFGNSVDLNDNKVESISGKDDEIETYTETSDKSFASMSDDGTDDDLQVASVDSINIDEDTSVNVEFNSDVFEDSIKEAEIKDASDYNITKSEINVDKYDDIDVSNTDIDDSHYDEYEKHIYDDVSSTGKDSIIVDVAKSMGELLKQNKDQRSIIKTLREKLETVTASRRNLLDRLKVMEQERENLNGRVRNYQNTVDKFEIKTKTLEDKVKEQERTIKSQNRELEKLRPQIEGKEDLIQLLADAKVVLNEDDNW